MLLKAQQSPSFYGIFGAVVKPKLLRTVGKCVLIVDILRSFLSSCLASGVKAQRSYSYLGKACKAPSRTS